MSLPSSFPNVIGAIRNGDSEAVTRGNALNVPLSLAGCSIPASAVAETHCFSHNR